MKILSSKQIYKADQATIQNKPISSLDLMEHAASICFGWILNYLGDSNHVIHIFCGVGNNGGDGLVLSRKFQGLRYTIKTYIVEFSNNKSEGFEVNFNRLLDLGSNIISIKSENDFPLIEKKDIIIDAIFGIGLTRSPTNWVKELIQHINNSNANIISIDLPSGLFAESVVEDFDSVIKSNETLTFQNPKIAFFLPDNEDYIKNWHLFDIGLDKVIIKSLKTNYYMVDRLKIKSIYKLRDKFSHKGTFGHCLIIGGSFGKIGAVILASKAALRIGSGLVTAYIPKCGYQIVQTSIPEVMVEVDSEKQLEYFNYKSKPTVIAIGVGIGTEDKTCAGFCKFLMNNKLPLVIDADGLNILAQNKKYLKFLPESAILTPHPKEFERLVGKWKNDYEKLDKLIKFSLHNNLIVVLKGANTAIAYKGELYFNSTGNSALSTAGSGDVLTGVIAGLIAQRYSPVNAAILGVYIHGKTADIEINEKSQTKETFIASDCIENMHKVFIDL